MVVGWWFVAGGWWMVGCGCLVVGGVGCMGVVGGVVVGGG